MIYEAHEDKQYAKTIGGLRELLKDWFNTPAPDVRIVPAWPLDLMCGLILLSPPILAKLTF
jgi:hypothetical protein